MSVKKEKRLTSSMEDYLEAIVVLEKENGVARVKDISRMLNVKPPSVTSAIINLSEKGLVEHELYGYVELTLEGKKAALDVLRRHNVLFCFLAGILNVDPKVALEDACKMEHSVSPQTLENLEKFIEFVKDSSNQGKSELLKSFIHFLKTGKRKRFSMGGRKQ